MGHATSGPGADESCAMALGRLLLDPSLTYQHSDDPVLFTAASAERRLGRILEVRPTVSHNRRVHGSSDLVDWGYRIGLESQEKSGLHVETILAVQLRERNIRYDQKTGEVGRGSLGGDATEPVAHLLRFNPPSYVPVSMHEQRLFHDTVVPQLAARVDRFNSLAVKEFGRFLTGHLRQGYPSEYEALLVHNIREDELAFLIAHFSRVD